uniref:Protein tweety homolog n=1 Tax=Sus scrofa TaxID=9823 RepID=A0A8D0XR00_PIG
MAGVSYSAPWWVSLLHRLPHFDLHWETTSSQFRPEDTDYQQALLLLGAAALACLALDLLFLLFYSFWLCCRRRKSEEHLDADCCCTAWCVIIATLVCSAGIAVGFYGNGETSDGIHRATYSLRHANRTVAGVQDRVSGHVGGGPRFLLLSRVCARGGRVRERLPAPVDATPNLSQVWDTATALNLTAEPSLQSLERQLATRPDPLRAVQRLQGLLKTLLGYAAAIPFWRNPAVSLEVLAEQVDLYDWYRWLGYLGLLLLDVAICLLVLVGLIRSSKGILVGVCLLGVLALIISWGALGLELAVSVGSSDFCVDPDTYVTRMVEEHSMLSGDILQYYVTCSPYATNPFQQVRARPLLPLQGVWSQSPPLMPAAHRAHSHTSSGPGAIGGWGWADILLTVLAGPGLGTLTPHASFAGCPTSCPFIPWAKPIVRQAWEEPGVALREASWVHPAEGLEGSVAVELESVWLAACHSTCLCGLWSPDGLSALKARLWVTRVVSGGCGHSGGHAAEVAHRPTEQMTGHPSGPGTAIPSGARGLSGWRLLGLAETRGTSTGPPRARVGTWGGGAGPPGVSRPLCGAEAVRQPQGAGGDAGPRGRAPEDRPAGGPGHQGPPAACPGGAEWHGGEPAAPHCPGGLPQPASGLRAGPHRLLLRRRRGPHLPGPVLLRHSPHVQLHRLQRPAHLAAEEGPRRGRGGGGGPGATAGARQPLPRAHAQPVQLREQLRQRDQHPGRRPHCQQRPGH